MVLVDTESARERELETVARAAVNEHPAPPSVTLG